MINTPAVKNVVYHLFEFLEGWKCNLGNIFEEKTTVPVRIRTKFLRFEVQNYISALCLPIQKFVQQDLTHWRPPPRKFQGTIWIFWFFKALSNSFKSIKLSKVSITAIKSKRGPKLAGKVWDLNLWPQWEQNLLNKNVIFKINFQIEHTWAHIWDLS